MTRVRLIRLTAASIAIPVLLAASPSFSQDIKKIEKKELKKKNEKTIAAQDPLLAL